MFTIRSRLRFQTKLMSYQVLSRQFWLSISKYTALIEQWIIITPITFCFSYCYTSYLSDFITQKKLQNHEVYS